MKELVHKREISIQSYDLGNHTILVEGSLIDNRYRPRKNEAREESQPVHHMVIRLKVKGPAMLIEEADATMPHHPRIECPVVLPWIRKLEGLSITAGFSMKVKKAIGNVRGCAHLTSLAIAMGPSAVQGYGAAYDPGRTGRTLRDQHVRNIVNSCYLWREDGPLAKELQEELESPTS
jgi:hypothetical protein